MTDLFSGSQWRALLALLLLTPLWAHADILDSVNAVRAAGCPGGTRSAPLQRNARLDDVAHRIAGGASLHSAQQQAGYLAVSSFLISIGDVPSDGDVRHIIETQFCPQSTNPVYREIGIWRQGNDVWLALAQPFNPPATQDRPAVAARVLELINAARASTQRCGGVPYPAVAPLVSNATLEHAAQDYAQEMATFGFMDHTGHDGSAPHERITRSGYRWSDIGENLASGVATPEAAVEGWLHSPEHCANIMEPAYTQMGVGFATSPRSDAGIYWALEFGRPAGRH